MVFELKLELIQLLDTWDDVYQMRWENLKANGVGKINQSERGTVSNKKTEEDVEQVRDGKCKLKPFVGA